MKAKYATVCAACSQKIQPGEEIARHGTKGWVHATCPSKDDQPAPAPPVPPGTTEVYTDGACSGNPGPGGWAWAVADGRRGFGSEAHTTNQRMEIKAALEAVRSISGPLIVVSDSTYVVNCFRDEWWRGWRARGWQTSAKKPVKNRDLWEPLVDRVLERGDVTFRWVKGHSGDPMNDLVDSLAVEAGQNQTSDQDDDTSNTAAP